MDIKNGLCKIPKGTKKIERDDFEELNQLKEVIIPDSIESIDENVFSGCINFESIFVPAARVSDYKQLLGTQALCVKPQFECVGYHICVTEDSNLRQFIMSFATNQSWQNGIEDYKRSLTDAGDDTEKKFNVHRNKCKQISSLKNRVFSSDEWDILKEKFNEICPLLKIDDECKMQEQYKRVTEILFPSFKKSKEEKSQKKWTQPFCDINRLFAGWNREKLCTIINDQDVIELLEELSSSGYIKFDDELLEIKINEGGWLVRSSLLYKLFNHYRQNDDTIPWTCHQALKDTLIADLLEKNKNIILTGAPGTGKTYLAKSIASYLITGKRGFEKLQDDDKKKFVSQYKFVQFHSSYDYTDFVEGLRPIDEGNGEIKFKRKDGIFKAFCAKAANDTNKKNNYVIIIDEINRGEISKIFGELFFSIDPGYRGEFDKDGNDNKVNTQYQNLIPAKIKDPNGQEKDNTDPFKNGFYVPNNVYVIGTMNDIDRSVESMDFAFRRRFAFHEVKANSDMLNILSNADNPIEITTLEELKKRMERLNEEIIKDEYGLSSAYQIGGAYFLNYKKYSKDKRNAFNHLWENHLQGLLFEYFRGLPQKDIENKMTSLKNAYDGK